MGYNIRRACGPGRVRTVLVFGGVFLSCSSLIVGVPGGPGRRKIEVWAMLGRCSGDAWAGADDGHLVLDDVMAVLGPSFSGVQKWTPNLQILGSQNGPEWR